MIYLAIAAFIALQLPLGIAIGLCLRGQDLNRANFFHQMRSKDHGHN